jgi:hypothetical protein
MLDLDAHLLELFLGGLRLPNRLGELLNLKQEICDLRNERRKGRD